MQFYYANRIKPAMFTLQVELIEKWIVFRILLVRNKGVVAFLIKY